MHYDHYDSRNLSVTPRHSLPAIENNIVNIGSSFDLLNNVLRRHVAEEKGSSDNVERKSIRESNVTCWRRVSDIDQRP
jgi:hypothetical protein